MNRPDNILAYDEMDLKKKVPLIRATLNYCRVMAKRNDWGLWRNETTEAYSRRPRDRSAIALSQRRNTRKHT